MRRACEIVGVLVLAGMNAQADPGPRAAEVSVYVKGDSGPEGAIDYGARATVTWMYARIGIRLGWHNGAAGSGASGSTVAIQVRFAGESPSSATRDALALALPFADGIAVITVLYRRIQTVAGRSAREQSILSHVLAHEIGHVLQRSDQHAKTGVMKGHWNGQDYDAMQKKPLEFTPDDVELIVQGLTELNARPAGDSITRPMGNGRK